MKQQLYDHLSPIILTIQVRQTKHAGHCWRSKDELKSNILLWIHTHGHASVGEPALSSALCRLLVPSRQPTKERMVREVHINNDEIFSLSITILSVLQNLISTSCPSRVCFHLIKLETYTTFYMC